MLYIKLCTCTYMHANACRCIYMYTSMSYMQLSNQLFAKDMILSNATVMNPKTCHFGHIYNVYTCIYVIYCNIYMNM